MKECPMKKCPLGCIDQKEYERLYYLSSSALTSGLILSLGLGQRGEKAPKWAKTLLNVINIFSLIAKVLSLVGIIYCQCKEEKECDCDTEKEAEKEPEKEKITAENYYEKCIKC